MQANLATIKLSTESETANGGIDVPTVFGEGVTIFDSIYSGLLAGASRAGGITLNTPAGRALTLLDVGAGAINGIVSNGDANLKALYETSGSFLLGSMTSAVMLVALPAAVPGALAFGLTMGVGTALSYLGTKAGTWVYENQGLIEQAYNDALNGITETWDSLLTQAEALGEAIMDSIVDTYVDVENWVTDTVQDAQDFFSHLKERLQQQIDTLGEVASELLDPLKDWAEETWQEIEDGAEDIGRNIADLFDLEDLLFPEPGDGDGGSGDGSGGGGGEGPGEPGEPGEPGGPGGGSGGSPGPDSPLTPNGPHSSPPISPLILDMDGDGVELMSLLASHVRFDLDDDGFAELTGWLKADDALLVMDLNSNGRIDSIAELFGNETTDGFTELLALDDNGDGKIDQLDSQFLSLKLWHDLNENGRTDDGELFSLQSAAITSIDVLAAVVNESNEGHIVSHRGGFTFSDGTSGTIEDIWFQNDQQTSTYIVSDTFSYAEGAFAIPFLKGYGTIPNLHVAVSLDSSLLQAAQQLTSTAHSGDLTAFFGDFEAFLWKWAEVDSVDPNTHGPLIDGRKLEFLDHLFGKQFTMELYGDAPGPVAAHELEAQYNTIVESLAARFLFQLPLLAYAEDLVTSTPMQPFSHPLQTLLGIQYDIEADRLFANLEVIAVQTIDQAMSGGTGALSMESAALLIRLLSHDMDVSGGAIEQSVGSALAEHSLDSVAIASFVESAFGTSMGIYDGTSSSDTLQGTSKMDLLQGGDGDDVYIWGAGGGRDVINEQGNGTDYDRLVLLGLNPSDIRILASNLPGHEDDAVIVIRSTGEQLIIDDEYVTGASARIEAIEFQDGTVWSGTTLEYHSRMWVEGTAEADHLEGGDENDGFVGGGGNDTLSGGKGNDSYEYSLGDGNDDISDISYSSSQIDTLILHSISPEDLAISTGSDDHNDLLLAMPDGGRILLINQFLDRYNGIEKIQFDDGSIWTYTEILARTIEAQQSAGNDIVEGYYTNDTLEGGLGNDFMGGGTTSNNGADTYIYSLGDGADIIRDRSFASSQVDILILNGINVGEVSISRATDDQDDMLLTFSDGGSIRVEEQYYDKYSGIERIEFDDGTVWSKSQLFAISLLQSSTDGDDTIQGFYTNDTIVGGLGDDFLIGADGSDIYVFNAGDGDDQIKDGGMKDTDQLYVHGYLPSDVTVSWASGTTDGLVLTFDGTSDRITIHNTLDGNNIDQIEKIVFDDGTIWTPSTLTVSGYWGNDGNDVLVGASDADTIVGNGGNDILTGAGGSDRFVFTTNWGQDVVTDFDGGNDLLDLSDTGHTFGDLTISQIGNDTLISDAMGNEILLLLVQASEISATDFTF